MFSSSVLGDQTKEEDIYGARGTRGGKQKYLHEFGEEIWSSESIQKTYANMGENITDLKETEKDLAYFLLDQDRDDWLSLQYAAMTLRVPYDCHPRNK